MYFVNYVLLPKLLKDLHKVTKKTKKNGMFISKLAYCVKEIMMNYLHIILFCRFRRRNTET